MDAKKTTLTSGTEGGKPRSLYYSCVKLGEYIWTRAFTEAREISAKENLEESTIYLVTKDEQVSLSVGGIKGVEAGKVGGWYSDFRLSNGGQTGYIGLVSYGSPFKDLKMDLSKQPEAKQKEIFDMFAMYVRSIRQGLVYDKATHEKEKKLLAAANENYSGNCCSG